MVIFKTESELVKVIEKHYGLTLEGTKGKYNLLSPTGKILLELELTDTNGWTFCGLDKCMDARSDIGITLKLNPTPQEKESWLKIK